MKYTIVSLCRIKDKSCFACCGHSFGTKEDILLSIRKNDLEYRHKKSLKEFMKDSTIRESGVCRCVITLKDGTYGCPGHPKQARKEMRGCNIIYECKTNFLFHNEWGLEKQKRFLEQIKDMNSIEYTMFMMDEEKQKKWW